MAAAVVAFMAGELAVAAPVTIAGRSVQCADIDGLDAALASQNPVYFAEWQDADYDAAESWILGCREFGLLTAQALRAPLFNQQRTRYESEQRILAHAARRPYQKSAEKAVEAAEAERKSREASERAAALAASEDRNRVQKERTNACEASSAYRRHRAAERIIATLEAIDVNQAEQSIQRKYARESGVRDLRAERNLGESMVDYKESLANDFQEYRGAGGKAKTPRAVKLEGRNPCD